MIQTWSQRCSQKSSRCSPTPSSRLNGSCYGSRCGMNLLFYKRPIFFPKLKFSSSQFNKWLHNATFQHQELCFWMTYFFSIFFNMLLLISLLFLQLEIEALKFFAIIVSNFSLAMKEVPNMIPLFSYTQYWRLAIWETYFF